MNSTFRYVQVKVRATRLPGKFRIDPLAVVYTGGEGAWAEVGETELRANEWNPRFARGVQLPADSSAQQGVELRVDFYNKTREDSRFLGTASVHLSAVLAAGAGIESELALETPTGTSSKSRVFVSVLEGYNSLAADGGGNLKFGLQLGQTNHWGVSMKVFYEIAVPSGDSWVPVLTSPTIKTDRQGWGAWDGAEVSLKEVVRDELATPMMFAIYRHKVIGHKRLLGSFQTSVKELARMQDGAFINFTPNAAEDILAADVIVTHSRKSGMDYHVGLKLVNVRWNAPVVTEENNLG